MPERKQRRQRRNRQNRQNSERGQRGQSNGRGRTEEASQNVSYEEE